ncbi:SusC/RagA family TonB-linked outer membrane protein [Prevotella merdae]|uniref:SusC/RagA family TonB-linked outer membrane protein n=1 Tax=Prevotella merdae TaxID=2079531 RepID=UPI003F8162C0
MEQTFLLTAARKAMLVAFFATVPAFSLPSLADTVKSVNIQQQAGKVKGQVFDSNGEPVIGASVKIVGQKNSGAITDIDGNFVINAQNGQSLEISYIGFKSKTVKVNGPVLNVKLEDDAQLLNDVVVVGYGTMRKKDLTGSVMQINPDKLANENPATVQDLLRGTPGLNVGYSADAKGGGSMQIRGQRSVYTDGGHNDPLIILDGMAFYGELSEINPDDIGQIDVLKDASAAAVYGAKAANGVIIVTTKKGKLGKPTINFNANLGINTKSDYTMNIYNPEGYMKYREDWYKADSYGMGDDGVYGAYRAKDNKGNLKFQPGYFDTAENAQRLYGVDQATWAGYTKNADDESMASIYAQRLGLRGNVLQNYLDGQTVDWWDKTFRTGINQDYNASISGASETMNYYMSAGFLHNEGAVKGNDYRSIRANIKVSGKVTNWLEVGANVNFQDRSDGDIQVGLGTNYWDSNQLRNSPFSIYRNEDGTLAQYPMDKQVYGGYNYDFERQYLDLEKGYQVLNTIFNAKVTLPFGITYSFNASPRYQYFYNRYFTSASRPDTNAQDRGVDRGWGKRFDWSLNNTITWDHTFAKKHHVVLTLVQEAEERRYWSDNIYAREILPSDALGFHNTQNATLEKSSFSTSDSHQTADALLARLFYSYDDRYMITASVRRDGYSAFGNNNPYATFPSVALAWTFTNEKFWKWSNIMNTGKLRASWGKNGNRSLSDPYVALADLNSGTGKTMNYLTGGNIVDMKYLSVNRMANPNLQWEKTEAINLGLDFGFLNDRITGSIDYYHMMTKDMIMNQRLPDFCGFGSMTTNLGQVNNDGIELSLNTVNIKEKNFEWRTSLGLSWNKNTIKKLYGTFENILDVNGNVIGRKESDDLSNKWFIGKSIGTIWDYEVTGIWQVDEYEEAAKYGQRPGDPKVWNNPDNDQYNADGTVKKIVYGNEDKKFLGQSTPKVRWSLRNDFTIFKNWSVGLSIYSMMGHKSLSGWYLNNDNGGSLITNGCNTWVKGYWTPENPTNKYARLNAQGPQGATGAQKLINRSFVRFDNLSVAYTFPKEWLSSTGISRLKLFFNIKNLGTIHSSDWEYGDPETSGLATRTFTFGMNVTL